MVKRANIVLEYQNVIPTPPIALKDMYKSACSADDITIEAWGTKWLQNIADNKAKYGSFGAMGIGTEFGKWAGKPCILAGAGPSLAKNVHLLKTRPKDMCLVSCLHNYHYMIDHDARPDYFVSLDAGDVTIEEVTEGSTTETDYWGESEKYTLVCYIGTSPKLLEKWKGKILFFNAPVPSQTFRDKVFEIEPFAQWISNGGNVLGACMYFAKAYLGCQVSLFVGADFSFSNEHEIKFHPWNSKYDHNAGNYIHAVDVYGNKVKTWGSYWHFKLWFDFVAYVLPGIYINCTEGGIFGAYREGNIANVAQMDLAKAIETFSIHEKIRYQAEHPNEISAQSDIILV
jgi:hypothetical protein